MRRSLRAVSLIALAAVAGAVSSSAQSIFTVAGGRSDDGKPAVQAPLWGPRDVATDSAGNVFIADWFDARIRRIDAATGIITTVAGIGGDGFAGDGGPATEASFWAPYGLTVDATGAIFIADWFNGRVRRVDPVTGIIDTVAGTELGYGDDADGIPALEASMFPEDVVVDATGNLYIAELAKVRRVDAATGIITTVAGTGERGFAGDGGPATSALLDGATSLALDAFGSLYVAEQFNGRVRKIDLASGIITTVAGNGDLLFSGDGGPATAASLGFPSGLAVDQAGNLLIADRFNSRIRRVERATGIIRTVAGSANVGYAGDGGPATAARLLLPEGVAVAPSGEIIIADSVNQRIRRVDLAGVITTIGGSGRLDTVDGVPGTETNLRHPEALAVDSRGNLYIADWFDQRIRRVDPDGIVTTIAGNGFDGSPADGIPAAESNLNYPEGVAVDAVDNIWVADTGRNRIRKIDATTGRITTIVGSGARGFAGDGGPALQASLNAPTALAFDRTGNLYFTDSLNTRIRKVDAATGTITTVAGNGLTGFSGDGGPATQARFNDPAGIALDEDGHLYVADSFNFRVRRIDAFTGIITTAVGTGSGGFEEGLPAIETPIAIPSGVVFHQGTLYVTDTWNQRVRAVDPETQIVTTVAGSGESGFRGDRGPALAAALFAPNALALNAAGDLYIASSNRVRVVYACVEVDTPAPLAPSEGTTVASLSPPLAWTATRGAFSYDVHLATGNGPMQLVAADLTTPAFTPANLDPEASHTWRVVAKGDPFCAPPSVAASQTARFHTPRTCSPPPAVEPLEPSAGSVVAASGTVLRWAPAAGTASHEVYFGASSPPPLVATTRQPQFETGPLAEGTRYFWFVIARASCDADRASSSPIREFRTGGACLPPGEFQTAEPASGATGLGRSVVLSWSTSSSASSYDVFFGPSDPPPFAGSAGSSTTATIKGLDPSTRYFWRVRARSACDDDGRSTALATFETSNECAPPAAPRLVTYPDRAVTVGQTYLLAWEPGEDLDTGGYVVERSRDAAFASGVDRQRTAGTSATFVAEQPGTHHHRVVPISSCNPDLVGSPSSPATVSMVEQPDLVFSAEPQAVIAPLGARLEDLKSAFTLENIGSAPLTVAVSAARIGSIPFFGIRDPAGSDPRSILLQPGAAKSLEIVFSGPPTDVPGSYEGIVIAATPGGESVTYAHINLKVGAAEGVPPEFTLAGEPTSFVYFPAWPGSDAGRPPVTIQIRNRDTRPIELAAEIGPEVWLEAEPGWNAEPIPPGGSRTVRLFTNRRKGPSGAAFPRYTNFVVRSADGETARLLVQDNEKPALAGGGSRTVGRGVRSLLIPDVITGAGTGAREVSRVRLTNLSAAALPAELTFTPEGVSGDSAEVRRATIVVPPNDVATLVDPLRHVFGITSTGRGQIEVTVGGRAPASLRIDSAIVSSNDPFGSLQVVPVLRRGQGATETSPHEIAPLAIAAGESVAIVLGETSGVEAARVEAQLVDGEGVRAPARSFEIPPLGSRSLTASEIGLAGTPFNGLLELRVAGAASVSAIARVFDPETRRGSVLVSEPVTPEVTGANRRGTTTVTRSLVVPWVARGKAAGATGLRTMLALRGIPGSTTDFELLFRDAQGGAAQTKTVTLRSTSTAVTPVLEIADVLGQVFQLPEQTTGSIVITSDSGTKVQARLGNAGQGITGLDVIPLLSEIVTSIENRQPLFIEGLEQSIDGDRNWNLVLSEVRGGSGTVRVQLYEAANRRHPIAAADLQVGPHRQVVLESVFGALGLEEEGRLKNRSDVLCLVIPQSGNLGIVGVAVEVDGSAEATTAHLLKPGTGSGSGGVSTTLVTPIQQPERKRNRLVGRE